MKLLPHIHIFNTPIHSRYVGFSTREIIYECRCGRKCTKTVTKSFGSPFPIATSTLGINEKKIFDEILNGNISESSEIILLIEYRALKDSQMVGKRFVNKHSHLFA